MRSGDLRYSILLTIHLFEHNKDRWYTIKDIVDRLFVELMMFNKPDRRHVYRTMNALIDFGYPIEMKAGKHNEHLFRWDSTKDGNTRKVTFSERISQYALSHSQQDENELDEIDKD